MRNVIPGPPCLTVTTPGQQHWDGLGSPSVSVCWDHFSFSQLMTEIQPWNDDQWWSTLDGLVSLSLSRSSPPVQEISSKSSLSDSISVGTHWHRSENIKYKNQSGGDNHTRHTAHFKYMKYKKISNIICIIYSFSWIEVSKTNCYYIMFYIKSLLRSEVEVGVGQTFLFDIKGWTEGVDTSIWMTLDLLMR